METVKKYLQFLISLAAVIMTIVHLYTYSFGLLPAMEQRVLFLGFAAVLILLLHIRDQLLRGSLDLFSILLLACTCISCVALFLNWEAMSLRLMSPNKADLIMGIVLITVSLYCTYIRLGPALPLIALLFIVYGLFGYLLKGDFATGYVSAERLISHLTMETSGIFGTVLGTAAKYIFIFVIFGSFLEYSGANGFFLDFTDRLIGGRKGSGAKIDVVSSCLFGTISGSAVANVMATAPMTIPIMRKNGFDGKFAGAVSAIAGTGGQLMPPVMGTAAFIIAETLAVGYSDIAKAALLPGILFYLTLWSSINVRANRLGIRGTRQRGDLKPLCKNAVFYVTPIVFLITAISILQWSPMKAGIWSIVLVIVLSFFNKGNRMGIRKILKAMEHAAYNCLSVGAACAAAGIIIGVLSLTGIGLKFSGLLLTFSHGNFMLLLVFTMIAGLILGMGMTTTSVYIVLSVLVAPALVSYGIEPVAAHLFVFYFGILSCITPPVSTAAYASASIAGEHPTKLALLATKTAIPVYLLPFLFVQNPELLMLKGSPLDIAAIFILSALFLCIMTAAIEGYYKREIRIKSRIVLFLCPISMLIPGWGIKLAGLFVCIVLLGLHEKFTGRKPPQEAVGI